MPSRVVSSASNTDEHGFGRTMGKRDPYHEVIGGHASAWQRAVCTL